MCMYINAQFSPTTHTTPHTTPQRLTNPLQPTTTKPPTTRDVQGADAEPGAWETSVLYSKVLAPLVVILPLW